MKKVKRPKWATVRKNARWKIVTEDRISCVSVENRINDLKTSTYGGYLKYPKNTIVKSPNGVWKDHLVTCAPGIHAYTKRSTAKGNADYRHLVICVYAPKWWGKGAKQRAEKVYVAN